MREQHKTYLAVGLKVLKCGCRLSVYNSHSVEEQCNTNVVLSTVSVQTLHCFCRLSVYRADCMQEQQSAGAVVSVVAVEAVQGCCRLSVYNSDGVEERYNTDAVVFAVGVKAMDGIVAASPSLAACPVGIFLSPTILPFVHTPALSVSPGSSGARGSSPCPPVNPLFTPSYVLP